MEYYFSNQFTKLYLGDSQKVLNEEKIKVNKIITSPPYNIIRPNSSDRGYDIYKDGLDNEDYINWTIENFKLYDKVLEKNGAIIYNLSYGTENTEVMNLVVSSILKATNFTLADVLVWKKQMATPNNVSSNKMTRIVEFVYVFCRQEEFYTFTSNKKVVGYRKSGQALYENMYNFFATKNNDKSTEFNKATFSSDFVDNIIDRYVLKTDIVLDPFSGTGTTSYACERRGIKNIGIELSKTQIDYSVERIKNMQLKLF